MSPLERDLIRLAKRTKDVRAPSGFEARVLARVARESRGGEMLVRVGQGALGLSLCAALAALSLALWHDLRLQRAMGAVPAVAYELEAPYP